MKGRKISKKVITRIAKLSRISGYDQEYRLGQLLRIDVAVAYGGVGGYEINGNGKVVPKRAAIKSAAAIKKLAGGLAAELRAADPYSRQLLSSLLTLPQSTGGKVPPALCD